MRKQHTPAPWFAVQYANQWNIQSEDGYEGVNTNVIDEEQDENHEANAKLIEAAPSMYEALKVFLKVISRSPAAMYHYGEAIEKGETAIAKAEGKEVKSHE